MKSYQKGNTKYVLSIFCMLMKISYFIMTCMQRSSRPEVFCKKGDFRNFAKCTRKPPKTHVPKREFINTLFKKRLWHSCFPVSFRKFLRTPFLIEHLRWLLLHVGAVNQKGSFQSVTFQIDKCQQIIQCILQGMVQ